MSSDRDQDSPPGPSPSPAREVLVELLYREHGTALLRFTAGLTGGDRQLAEDVVQETLLRAWKHAERLSAMDPAAIRPWLVTVARRLVIDAHRARSARPREADPAPLEVMPGPDEMAQALETMVVSDALDTLTPHHRQALVETYLKGRSIAQAATDLGIPPGTMKSRVYYALQAMRLALKERDEGQEAPGR
ncbi:sigma-70 family RNA polymerase sigma factor [Streptomyces sp. NBC_00233]|uniref:sigma-70 family RNA polymerase sigma factor n=1 Tax=Streptomyces sp. NBC_00233 TaxID=2975686 RepID=UPI002259BD9D|nr:sigma-70 family RNA polymerase sigma factor [Streptomyces sp. NBC_00233]MCX5233287.1 sigma-70 family RNA polymerase sigma factor [Streptomyces sp. NBC_00233]